MLKNDIFINQLKEKLSIVDIIGKRVTWDNKKTNVNNGIYWSCCPFHNEKTASFKVDQNRGLFYCFGCHEKGDTISFTISSNVVLPLSFVLFIILFIFLLENITSVIILKFSYVRS